MATPTLASTPTSAQVLLEGWAEKQGKIRKQFRRRFWQLKGDGQFVYYVDPQIQRSRGVITIADPDIQILAGQQLQLHSEEPAWAGHWRKSTTTTWGQRLAIRTPRRCYFLGFETAGQCSLWADKLREAVAFFNRTGITAREAHRRSQLPGFLTDVARAEFLSRQYHEVIVIGAGVAGLAAAWHLRNSHRVEDVLVLEASDRAGGRVREIELPSLPGETFDAGASWIHGTVGNPIADLANSINMEKVVSTEGLQQQDVSLALFDQGEAIEPEDLQRAHACHKAVMEGLEEDIEGLVEAFEDRGEELPPDQPMSEAYARELHKRRYYKKADDRQKRLLGYLRSRDEEFNAAPFSTLSYNHFLEDEDPPGPQYVTRRMCDLIDHMLETVNVAYETEVVKVTHSFQDGHQVSFSSHASMSVPLEDAVYQVTTANGARYYARTVVVAVPLPVLQQERIEFVPPLPAKKQESIQRIGFGTLDKVFLHFERPFWDEDPVPEHARDCEYIASVDVANAADLHLCLGKAKQRLFTLHIPQSMPLHFLNYHRWFKLPVLTAMIYGEMAERLEGVSEKELEERLVGSLRRMYPTVAPELLQPKSVVATRWHRSPIQGSFSVMRLGASGQDMDNYAEPLLDDANSGGLFFAGEATDKDHYATVHGAFRSGRSAAERVVAAILHTTVNAAKEPLINDVFAIEKQIALDHTKLEEAAKQRSSLEAS
ncbi:uncharacterized protein MONBRDRAFT_33927 [Monosiga brevicollis MX1]|uniref:PH domain-containing protein n=1 Tax=Monosiga brevicollis TaxID=81824 RepID=A9V8J0_MONBE|nr:uncharacterized protein MONBRDRAFT_33927 [Monosiga brevicollis MX1]EDQ86153.1 predicted protein [Monosiga brevicollis MX1]|eukprot:XP_001749078.1 hypothetical protein [Monosiga brevicollis MX1]